MHGSGAGLLSRLLLTCKSFFPSFPSLSFRPRACTMAQNFEFTPGFMRNMERVELAGQVDVVAVTMALIATGRAMMPLGRRLVEATLRRLAGEANVDPEEVFSQMDYNAPQQLAGQQQLQQQQQQMQQQQQRP